MIGGSPKLGRSGSPGLRIAGIGLMALTLLGAARPEAPATPAPPLDRPILGRYDYAGLIHVHTDQSDDALGDLEGRARDAARQGIRFVVLTDHNTLGREDAPGGWRDGVLMVAGLESSRPEGHLVAFGMKTAPLGAATPTTDFIGSVQDQKGVVALPHPVGRRWSWDGPLDPRIGAMEIVNLADQFKSASTAAKASTLALLPFVGRDAFVRLAGRPDDGLALWDRTGASRRMTGYLGSDIHEAVEITDTVRLRFPRAADIMQLGRNHILTTTPLTGDAAGDQALVLDAVRRGRLYVSFDILGNGRGFDFSGVGGGRRLEMGDEAAGGAPVAFDVVLPEVARGLEARIRLLRDGVVIASGVAGATGLSWVDSRPGVYRVEVVVSAPTVPQAPGEMVWIYSNPIYLRAARSSGLA